MYSYIIFICVAQVSFESKFGISDLLRIYIYTIEYVYEWLRPTLTLFKKNENVYNNSYCKLFLLFVI